ncbi:MAG: UvrD-helicase domain-containing protein, partial [Simkaniaceae bacterium]|nr:UvrD-helicase domain-containing protein [Simkaniaceae bacterium]
MRRFNCLEKDLALFGNHFIEASAGTGKTFAMEHVVCRLLLASDLPIREILVVTFTRAATRELTGRIAETLRSALKQLKGDKVSFPYLEELVGDQTAQLRLERALRTFDESQIFTIHAFCYKMLLEFPFESGLDVSHSNPDETPYEKVMEEAIVDFFRNDVRLPSYHACQLEAVLSMARGSFSRLMGLVAGLVLRDITLPEMLSWDVAIEKCEELCRSLPHGFLSEFEAYASRFKGVCDISGRPRAEFQELAEKIEAGDASFLSGETALFSLLSRDNLKKGKEFPPSGALRCAVEAFLPLIEQVRDPKAILLR